MRCANCRTENPDRATFCSECATPLARQLASTQSSAAALEPLAPARAEAERGQLTVMFCDVVGSTSLSAQLDPEEFRAVRQAYPQAWVSVTTRFDGHVATYLGDGVLAYFGYPTAHDAIHVVRPGLGTVAAIEQLLLPHILLPFPLQVRVGIHKCGGVRPPRFGRGTLLSKEEPIQGWSGGRTKRDPSSGAGPAGGSATGRGG